VKNCILWGNQPQQIYPTGLAQVTYSNIQEYYPGAGNISTDPLFISADMNDFRLQQDPCQPGITNACINSGDPLSTMIEGTTRTDGVQDIGIVDLGYHYQGMAVPPPLCMILGFVTPGFPGLSVNLKDSESLIIETTITSLEGYFEFGDLNAGEYLLELDVPNGYTVDNNDVSINLASGDTVRVDFTMMPIHSAVVGLVTGYYPANRTLYLQDASGLVMDSTFTDNGGAFEFTALDSGSYWIELCVPEGFGSVGPNPIPVGLAWADTVLVGFELAPLYATVVGTVTPGFADLTVDLFDTSGYLVESVLTTDGGSYDFMELTAGTYFVDLVRPIGFILDQDHVQVDLEVGDTSFVEFNLTPIVTVNQARGKGYWKHQVSVNLSGRGNADYSTQELMTFSQDVFDHFYCNSVSPITVQGVTFNGFTTGPLTMTDLQEMLTINQNGSTPYERACQQYLTLLLNVISEKLGQYALASIDQATVSQAIVYLHQILQTNPTLAKSLSE